MSAQQLLRRSYHMYFLFSAHRRLNNKPSIILHQPGWCTYTIFIDENNFMNNFTKNNDHRHIMLIETIYRYVQLKMFIFFQSHGFSLRLRIRILIKIFMNFLHFYINIGNEKKILLLMQILSF